MSSATEPCPCAATSEHQCNDGSGTQKWNYYCNPVRVPCPCQYPTMDCFNYSYDGVGRVTDSSTSCAISAAQCTCGPGALSVGCLYGVDSGSPYALCDSAARFSACTIHCSASETECYPVAYSQTGLVDLNAAIVKTCAPAESGCPCNSQWEYKCTASWGSWCTSKESPCPLICTANQQTCWNNVYDANGMQVLDKWGAYRMQETCQPADAPCPCNGAAELTCTMGTSYTSCLPKSEYSQCPIDCSINGTVACYPSAFDSNGLPDYNVLEVCRSSYDECPGLCGANARKCGTGSSSYCIWIGDACPLVCDLSTQFACWSNHFDSNGLVTDSVKSCVAIDGTCPCGTNANKCTDSSGLSYCQPSKYQCPLTCSSNTHKLCATLDYYANGTYSENPTESCVEKANSCPCGSGQLQCSVTDALTNSPYSWCQPSQIDGVSNPCPVICTASQEMCMVDNYNTNGVLTDFTESCITTGSTCQCGKSATRCRMGPSVAWCQPTWDSFENQRNTCPLYCNSTQKMCSVPNYDSFGTFQKFTQFCSAAGATCDCTKGSGSKLCQLAAGFNECIPSSQYCAPQCTGSQVQCPFINNYKKDATWLSSVPPANGQECQDKFSDCACGAASKRCTDPTTNKTWCQATGLGECPVICTQTQKLCSVANYNPNGALTSSKDRCVASNEDCPCGQGTSQCLLDGGLVCVSLVLKKDLCPCKPSEKVCYVSDYDTFGKFAGVTTVCTTRGEQCPCGKNTKKCEDSQSAGGQICLPKFNKQVKGCPSPCSVTQENAGKSTCLRTHLNSKGERESEEVSCVTTGQCSPGRGQKKCPTGSLVKASKACVNNFGLTFASARRLAASGTAIQSGSKQTATLKFILTSLQANAVSKTSTVKTELDSIIQFPSELQSTLSFVVSGADAHASFKVTNLGASKVTPSEVVTLFRTMIDTGKLDVKDALAALGTVKKPAGQSCCTISTDIKIVVDKTTTTSTTTTTTTTTTTPPPTTTTTASTTTTTTGATTTTNTATTTTTTTMTTTSTTTVALTQFQGVISFLGPGLTKSQVVTSSTASIPIHYNVPLSAVRNVVATESRRLVGATLRKLGGSWSVSFTLAVSQSQVAAVQSIAAAADSTGFSTTLRAELLTVLSSIFSAGVAQNMVNAVTVSSLSTVQIGAGSTTTTINSVTVIPLQGTGGSSLPETAFLSIILMSTIVMTFMM